MNVNIYLNWHKIKSPTIVQILMCGVKKRVELKMLDQSYLQCNMGILGCIA